MANRRGRRRLAGPSACSICRAISRIPPAYEKLAERLGQDRQGAATPAATALFYLATPPQVFAPIVQQLGEAGPRAARTTGTGGGSSSRSRSAPTCARRRTLNRDTPRRAGRKPDLPDRPLSRQGDGPEHHGAPLRQRHVRAAVEPQPHRSRADHRGRDGRRRAARQVLRRDRRVARHGAEPSLPAARP